jgi:formamidopyrimidine-DNA glycosylase
MPELPEVEGYARYFARHALKQAIARVEVLDTRVLGEIRKERLARELKGKSFRSVRRHGKHLFADAGATWLHLHFGMSGDLAYYRGVVRPRFARVVFRFDSGSELAFEDMRLFGVVDLTPSPEQFIAEHGLGPDPLDPAFTLRVFRDIVAKRRGAAKSLLMSQEIIAGVGNLYADETLFQTGIHPRRAVDTLEDDEVKAIYTTMRRILREVVDRQQRSAPYPRRYLIERREEGARCPVCGGEIRRTVVFGRTTYFCSVHQNVA